MATRTAYAPVASEVLTATNLAKLPGGWIGDVSVTASQTGITTQADITGLTLTVTVGTSRRIRVSAVVPLRQQTAPGVTNGMYIMEGATQLQSVQLSGLTAANFWTGLCWVTLTPTAGSHTYKVQTSTAGGTVDVVASATTPGQLIVEDIGAA